MPDTAPPSEESISGAAAEARAADGGEAEHLPRVVTPLPPEEILDRLERLAKRGRLPGFHRLGGADLFKVAAHGAPFDADLLARYQAAGGEGELQFRTRLHKRLPAVFAVALIATVWPGVYFADELIAQHLPGLWRPWVTYWWYLPLTVIPLPWVWMKLIKRSRRVVAASAQEAIEKIAGEVQGRMVNP